MGSIERRGCAAWVAALVLAFAGCKGTTTTAVGADTGAAPADAGALDASGAALASDAADAADASVAPDASVAALFVGNSYVYTNDVPGRYRALIGASRVEMVAPGGWRLAQHAQDALTDGTPLAGWLRTGTIAFGAVILQEQSQIGGFPRGIAEREESIVAAGQLADLATAHGSAVVLYMTWGRKDGDSTNASVGFGTFLGMEALLEQGYLETAALLRDRGANVRVAPVGGGFRTVYEDVMRAGADPLAAGSDFAALYEPDGSHPSPRGAYLAACIIAGTVTSANVRTWPDDPTLGATVSAPLRDACARALADPRWRF